MSSDDSGISDVIWSEITLFSSLKEVSDLKATCKFPQNVDYNKALWLKHLRELDQDHAPDLPRHISVDELDWHQVRTLVVRAYQRRLNCTGPAPLRPTREITVPIESASFNGALGKPYDVRINVQLLPGGKLLLVLWTEGYLQCWDVPGGKCVWTYPDPVSSDPHKQRVHSFSYDMQADNAVHILTVNESRNTPSKLRNFEILRISRETKKPEPLYESRAKEPHTWDGPGKLIKLYGDISAVYTERKLFLTFWKEDRSVVITQWQSIIDDVDMIGGYLICVAHNLGDKSMFAILLSSIRNALPNDSTITTLVLGDLPYAKCFVPSDLFSPLLPLFAEVSSCDFHWKSEAERKSKGIIINVLWNVYNLADSSEYSMVYTFHLETAADTTTMSKSEARFPNDGRPRLTFIGDPQIIAIASQRCKYHTYQSVQAPSQAGSSVTGYFENCSTCVLATISCGEKVVAHNLELPHNVKHMGVEFYSGAVYFPTMDAKSVVIQYFD